MTTTKGIFQQTNFLFVYMDKNEYFCNLNSWNKKLKLYSGLFEKYIQEENVENKTTSEILIKEIDR